MQRSNSWLRGAWLLLALSAFLLPALQSDSARAQIRVPEEALSSQSQLGEVLRQGAQLEQKRRWSEALNHYDQALKDYPGQSDLEQRRTLARIHLDVGRRYNDSTFTAALANMDQQQALEVYDEVLLKVHAHYVQAPNWYELVRRGTTTLDVALSEPKFVAQNLRGTDADRITAVRRQMRQAIDQRGVRNRHEARESVALAARIAAEQLGLAPQTVILEYTCGAIGALDAYSSFLTAGQYDDVMSQIEGNFVGLGIEIKADDNSLLIVNVISGGPADRSGMRSGDRIVEVDGQSTKDISTDKAADMLKGVEGSMVDVTLLTPQDATRRLRLSRERVEVPSVEGVRIIDTELGVAYIKLTSFQRTTVDEFNTALWSLHRQGMRSLIVDLRGNPGGLLQASVDLADKFVASGTIVSTRGRNPREDSDHQAHNWGTWRVPLIVLIDGYSASASEIFAGAIRDHHRGTIVGDRSYGKGSVQGIFPLTSTYAGLRLTTAKFFSPAGHPISKRGVLPDVTVHTTAKPVAESVAESAADGRGAKDAVLEAGLQLARDQFSQR